jgi:predicted SPOUT superfamily RNA methylase MTH1
LIKRKICVVFPTNVFSDISHLREKTIRIANLARTFFTFNVNEAILFNYENYDKVLIKLLNFFSIPSYLRKYVYKIDEDLKYVGAAPPIRANIEEDKENRIGLVVKNEKGIAFINAGLKHLIKIKNSKLKKGEIVKLSFINGRWELAFDESEKYFNFSIKVINDLINFLKSEKPKSFIIATSKELFSPKCKILNLENLLILQKLIKDKQKLIFLFGSPKEGLYEIFLKLNYNLDDLADVILNVFPNQGVITIRTDEAIFGTLSIFNLIF